MRKEDPRQMMKALGLVGSIGLNTVVAVAIGLFAGKWVDHYFGTIPFATVSGIILGMLAGLWAAYKRIMDKS
ncbi:hypothetical protein SDC9_14709 [bioreactor metagenome]|uniref:ATP synthase protein I n=1 Tax=bioreactor metagenome TaxID=1076179 RepID=A0A644TPQ3_9ZZZZ